MRVQRAVRVAAPNAGKRGGGALPCRASMLALLLAGLAGCIIVVPYTVTPEVSRSGDVPPLAGELALSVVFSTDFAPLTRGALAREMAECVARGLVEAAPEVRFVPQDQFYRDVFPGLKPAEVLIRADTIGALVARPQIRQRIGHLGLTHLVLVGGATTAMPQRSSRLTASLFDLNAGAEVTRVQTTAEGRVVGGGGPGGILAAVPATETAACDALGLEVARAIRGKAPSAVP